MAAGIRWHHPMVGTTKKRHLKEILKQPDLPADGSLSNA
jgi:hypothetical protein